MLASYHRTVLAEKNTIIMMVSVLVVLFGARVAAGISVLQEISPAKRIYVSGEIGEGERTTAAKELLRHIAQESERLLYSVRNVTPQRVPSFEYNLIYNSYPGDIRNKIADSLEVMSEGVTRRNLAIKTNLTELEVSNDLVFSATSNTVFYNYEINRPIAKEVLRLHLQWFKDKKQNLWIKDYYYEEIEGYHAL